MGDCVRWNMIQRISDAEKGVTATLTLKSQGGKTITLRAFNKVLKSIVEVTRPVTHKSLLKAHPFGMQYEDGIIFLLLYPLPTFACLIHSLLSLSYSLVYFSDYHYSLVIE